MPCDPIKMQKMDALLDSYLELREKYPDEDEELAEGATQPTPVQYQPTEDASPEMQKENLWEGKPPIPIEHL